MIRRASPVILLVASLIALACAFGSGIDAQSRASETDPAPKLAVAVVTETSIPLAPTPTIAAPGRLESSPAVPGSSAGPVTAQPPAAARPSPSATVRAVSPNSGAIVSATAPRSATPSASKVVVVLPTATPGAAASAACPAPVLPNLKSSGLIAGVTLARAIAPETYAPLDATQTFGRDSTIHAVVALENAPENTTVKAVWYANDVGSAARCNTLIDQALLTELDGTHMIDFVLSPGNPPGLYRAEISVNGQVDRVVNFTVR